MSFMQPQIRKGRWALIDIGHGEEVWTPSEYVETTDKVVERRTGFGARLSAPGYLDCTEWTVFETEEEAAAYLADQFDLCPTCFEPLDEDYGCQDCDLTEYEGPTTEEIAKAESALRHGTNS